MRFEGKVALITAGASGIGRATAQTLAREGPTVVIVDSAASRAKQVASDLRAAGAAVSWSIRVGQSPPPA